MQTIKFVPKTNQQMEETLANVGLKSFINNKGWPIANDHVVQVFSSEGNQLLGTFDGAVDSTNSKYSSIPRGRLYKGRLGVHFTESFGGNHLAVALSDFEEKFLMLERSWKFAIQEHTFKVNDVRGIINLNEAQEARNSLTKIDVEIHKGNIYYKTFGLSRGCPTVSNTQFERFLRTLFSNIEDLNILFTGPFCNVIIEDYPKETPDYSYFYECQRALQKIKRSYKLEVLREI